MGSPGTWLRHRRSRRRRRSGGRRGRGLHRLPRMAGIRRGELRQRAGVRHAAHRPLRLHHRPRYGPDRVVLSRRDVGPATSRWPTSSPPSAPGSGDRRRQRPRRDVRPHRRVPRPRTGVRRRSSQQLARLSGEEIRRLVDGATYLFSNDYEWDLMMSKTGWTDADVLAPGRSAGHHPGRQGRRHRRRRRHRHPRRGGAGDRPGRSHRRRRRVPARFLTGRGAGWTSSARHSSVSLVAVLVLETTGTQNWTWDLGVERSPRPTGRRRRRDLPGAQRLTRRAGRAWPTRRRRSRLPTAPR